VEKTWVLIDPVGDY